jgi:hypothetical protein
MITFIHRHITLVKKYSLTLFLAAFTWIVYAGDYNDSFYQQSVKVVKCYPNPAISYVNFEFPNTVDKSYILQVYSFTGKKMVEMPVSASKISLTLTNNYFRGIYVFQLRDKAGKLLESGKFQVVK